MVAYSQKTFSMFGGTEEVVSVEVPNKLAGVFIEKFGESVRIRPSTNKKNHFVARFTVQTSPQFYGWLCGLGADVKILTPVSVRDNYIEHLNSIISANTP